MRARSALAFAAGVVVGAVATYVRRPRRTVTTHTSSAPTVVDHLDQIRDNVAHARANVADRGFKPQYDAWLPVLLKHPTIGAAVAAGDLPTTDALFEAAS